MNNNKKTDRKNIIRKTVNFDQVHIGLHIKPPIFNLLDGMCKDSRKI